MGPDHYSNYECVFLVLDETTLVNQGQPQLLPFDLGAK